MSLLARWEWRCFFTEKDALENPFTTSKKIRDDNSREVYYLMPDVNLNLKLRYGILDLKKRLGRAETGLEQWFPIFKASLPLDPVHLGALNTHLAGKIHLKSRDVESELFDNAGVRVVHVHKFRQKYQIDDVFAEYATLTVDGAQMVTLALEHLEPERIQSCRQKFGLLSRLNESYPQALRRLKKLE